MLSQMYPKISRRKSDWMHLLGRYKPFVFLPNFTDCLNRKKYEKYFGAHIYKNKTKGEKSLPNRNKSDTSTVPQMRRTTMISYTLRLDASNIAK